MFKLPDKPGIKKAEQKPDQRKYCVIPYRAAINRDLTRVELFYLMTLASYSANNGFSYVSLTTIAKHQKCSIQNASRYIKRLERKGYVKTHRKGVNGIRGCLRQIVFDDTLTTQDIVAISNVPIPDKPFQYESEDTMKRKGKPAKQNINNNDSDITLDYDMAIKLVENLIKSDSDILKLERLVSQGITRTQLLAAFS